MLPRDILYNNEYFYNINNNKKLKCEGCLKRYNIPKIQSCGCSICSDCETEIFKNNEALAEIECSICHETYELPLTRFKINKHFNNFLDILPISVYRGGLHADAIQKLHDEKVLNENFLKEINDPKSLIIEFCNLQTNLIDIRTECLVQSINNHRDSQLEQNQFKLTKKCISFKEKLI